MKKTELLRSAITEYGVPWAIFRGLYSCKLKLLSSFPVFERLFESNAPASVHRVDIFSFDINSLSEFIKKLTDDEKKELINNADKASIGIIKGFSSITLDYGNPINWQLNPLSGKSCNIADKWFRIQDFDLERGDIKVIWEASRFTHFYAFSRAYMLTADKKYYEAFSNQLDDWLQKNAYSYGANYKCGQECALRMINGLMAYTVFHQAGIATDKDEENIKELIGRCYRKIMSNFFYAHRCIKNNHTVSELVGMIIGAWCCEDNNRLTKAYRLLDKVICEQFSKDGGYRQFSFTYQRLALQDIECVLSISDKTKQHLSQASLERIKQSALLLYQCQNDDGDVPNYGSNDGALIFPVTSCGYRDFRPTANCVYALTANARLYSDGTYDEELLWFCGNKHFTVQKPKRQSTAFPDAGLFTMRNDKCFSMMVLNRFKSRPAHMDQLHFDLWINGYNVFGDSGTFSYASELGKGLTLTGGHNTVKVCDVEQMDKHGAFMLCNWTRRVGFDCSADTFSGTVISKNGYIHKRQIHLTTGGCTITDEIELKKKACRKLGVLFHTPCDVSETVVLSHQNRPMCSMKSIGNSISIEPAERSLFYMKSEKVNLIKINTDTTAGKAKIITEIKVL